MATKDEIKRFLREVRKEQDRRNALKFATLTDFSSVQSKVSSVENGAQANVIETIKINGVPLSVNGKSVNLDLSGYVTGSDVASGLRYQGSVNTYSNLPSDASAGDVYNIKTAGGSDADGVAIRAGDNVVWNGSGWDVLAGAIDLTGYVEKDGAKMLSTNDFTNAYKQKVDDLETAMNTTFTESDLTYIFADD